MQHNAPLHHLLLQAKHGQYHPVHRLYWIGRYKLPTNYRQVEGFHVLVGSNDAYPFMRTTYTTVGMFFSHIETSTNWYEAAMYFIASYLHPLQQSGPHAYSQLDATPSLIDISGCRQIGALNHIQQRPPQILAYLTRVVRSSKDDQSRVKHHLQPEESYTREISVMTRTI